MKTKTFLIPFVAVLAVFLVSCVSASSLIDGGITTTFNDVALGDSITVAGTAGDTVPVRVAFTAGVTASDVRVKVWMEGYRNTIEASTSRSKVLDGIVYTELLNLELPSDLKDTEKTYTLHVSISNSEGYDEVSYTVSLQRDTYNYDMLSVDFDTAVSAGDVVPVSVVVKNRGMETLDDGYVVVTIPELGVSARGYFGDLTPVDNYLEDEDSVDAFDKTVYVKIPSTAKSGVYDITVKVYNSDDVFSATKLISVEASNPTQVLTAIKSQDMKAGETKTYDLIIVNSGSDIAVYNIKTISGSDLSVSAPSVVTVGPDASETVQVSVKASSDADEGAYTFTVDVEGEQVVLGANVTEKGITTSVVALTVILAIVFVVLLVVLIVLLTRRDRPVEEVETSYY